jgi:hypothetical protein
MRLQKVGGLFKSGCLQVKSHDLPLCADGFRQCMRISTLAGSQIDGEIAMTENFAGQLLTPGNDAG